MLRPQSKGGREPSRRAEGVATHAHGARTFQGESAEIGAARFFRFGNIPNPRNCRSEISESESLSFGNFRIRKIYLIRKYFFAGTFHRTSLGGGPWTPRDSSPRLRIIYNSEIIKLGATFGKIAFGNIVRKQKDSENFRIF